MKLSGWAPVGWMVGGIAWVATGLVGLGATVGTGGFYAAETAWLVVHLLILVGLAGLVRSGAVGELAWGTRGFAVAILGRIIFLVAEVAAIALGRDDLFLFPVAAVLTGVGMIVGGLAVVRAGRWEGPLRFAPLAMGVYPFVAMFPVLAVTGERPDAMLSCWGVLMLAVGLAMTRATATRGARSVTGRLQAPGPLPATNAP
jgi:hypothetical protein